LDKCQANIEELAPTHLIKACPLSALAFCESLSVASRRYPGLGRSSRHPKPRQRRLKFPASANWRDSLRSSGLLADESLGSPRCRIEIIATAMN
jgi:hypothetical protein